MQFLKAASEVAPVGADCLDYGFPLLDLDLSFKVNADGLFGPRELQDVLLRRPICDELRWFVYSGVSPDLHRRG